ncbi:sulfur carrier protein ThiS [Polynucleobacter kasalickyi]|uniref:Sulfur carrier protein n=1 Tax=Polynucleobacter kasalickyi TaxID=1938817 RepID=A0A1W2B6N7_9BURK|nr:sulfur carrier protein ThiS [Polynucleobacter kasalickyi]SMC68342.1 sulfur carrier protein [Polynucleobacter kasalickyi]
MQVIINLKPFQTSAKHLQELLAEISPKRPFGIAQNGTFIPKSAYDSTPVAEGDKIEVISPVTGG